MAERIAAALRLYAFAALGLFLLTVPWTPLWDGAVRAVLPSAAGGWLLSGWVRGAVSGLGALDLIVAAAEAGVFWQLLRRRSDR